MTIFQQQKPLPPIDVSGNGGNEALGEADGAAACKRRLHRSLLDAFHDACDKRDLAIAASLLRILEASVMDDTRQSANFDEVLRWLVAAHERFWELRGPADDTRFDDVVFSRTLSRARAYGGMSASR